MRRILASILAAALLLGLTGCAPSATQGTAELWADGAAERPEATGLATSLTLKSGSKQEMRGVWVSFLEFYNLVKGDFRENVENLLDNARNLGLNTVFVQVRPYSDAMYKSKYFPWSHVLTGEQGKNPGYDPLQIFIEEGHERGMEVHAWINPYRITDSGAWELDDKNPAVKLQKQGDDLVLASGSGLYYNPARSVVQSLVIKGVLEIVENYDVDGIHFDDYFYPTQDPSFDEAAYEELGDGKTLAEFRRYQVNKLIYNTYRAIKQKDSKVVFGISPAADIDKNMNEMYSDVKRWGSRSGYVDYLCPQIYFGFEHNKLPFDETAKAWNDLVTSPSVDLYIGLAAYKAGLEDAYAGDEGKSEWQENDDMLVRQIKYARNLRRCRGFALYRYESIFAPSKEAAKVVLKEKARLQKLLAD